MLSNKLKSIVPHAVAVLLFIVISLAYFPSLLEGKKLKQHDILMHRGMSKEIADYRAKTGSEALWTNSMFGGMPAYQISVSYKNNIAQYLNGIIGLRLDPPAYFLFVSLLGFYILLCVLKLDPWLSFAGALAFGFSAYFFIIETAGHNSKAHAMSLMAPILAGVLLTFRGKYIIGGILTALFLALQLNANHLQISYYTFLIIIIFGIVEFYNTFKNKHLDSFFKASGSLTLALVIAIGINFSNLYLTYEYGKYSTRGKSELTNHAEDKTSGLDKSYILNDYSYGISETFNLFIPNFLGGASGGALTTNSEVYKFFISQNYPPEQAKTYLKQMPLYWGDQRYTAGPVYIGAVVVFLFVLGLFAVKGPVKWWLVSATIFSIILAWGKNFQFVSDLFINYFPAYNKFRTVSMILVIAELTIPLLGILGLWKMFGNEIPNDKKLKYLRNATYIAGGFALLFALLPGMFFNFSSSADASYKLPEQMLDALRSDRKSLMQADAFRSLLFVLLSAGVIFAFVKNKLTLKVSCVAFSLLFLADLGFVGKRYLNSANFVSQHESAQPFSMSHADEIILQDKSQDYRVLNLATDPFNDASTSWFHKSIGGYHAAKMKRYQELIDFHLSKEIQEIEMLFRSKPTFQSIDSLFSQLHVLDMLNTKYIIYNPEAAPLPNNKAYGNAWFCSKYQLVKNADEEILALKTIDPSKEAVIDQRFSQIINNINLKHDSAATINLASYEPNHITYKSTSINDQLAVFSEIYYEKGWNAYVDGKLTPHCRADYVLRAMVVPSGSHTIDFKFEPTTYAMGERISLISSILLVLLILGYLSVEGKKMMAPQ